MEFLGIGPLELLVILLIALIAVGPRDLGKAARSTGRLLNRLYRSEAWATLTDASRNIRALPNRLAREAALEELDQTRREMQESLTTEINQVKSDLSPEPPPVPSPPPVDTESTKDPEAPVEDDPENNA